MKKLLFAMLAIAGTSALAGGLNKTITFRTNGPDTYVDGTAVKAGECYALVWTKAEKSFAGFLADGSVAEPENSRIIMVEPLAIVENGCGHCKTSQAQLNEAFLSKLGEGEFAVYLLDTRGADGCPIGIIEDAKEGMKLIAVNNYGVIPNATVLFSADEDVSGIANKQSALPVRDEAELAPVIKAVKIENGKFKVTVEKAVPYMKYDLVKPGESEGVAENEQSGVNPTVELEVPASGDGSATLLKATASRNF